MSMMHRNPLSTALAAPERLEERRMLVSEAKMVGLTVR
jgi:hypothetical protein